MVWSFCTICLYLHQINLLNLYACAYYACDFATYLRLWGQLDKSLFSKDALELIEQNAKNNIKTEDVYLFFDTETSGLPTDYNAPATHINNWPRLIQISWILATKTKEIICEKDYIVEPNGFSISSESTAIHGITNEIAMQKGKDIGIILKDFLADLDKANYIIGHNVSFDVNVVNAELIRKGYTNTNIHKKQICTMKSSVNICKIPDFKGRYKYPKLQELYD